jgi:putative oxidoreductase
MPISGRATHHPTPLDAPYFSLREGRAAVTSLPTSSPPELDRRQPTGLVRLVARAEALGQAASRYTVPLLRISLGVVYIWFGALKVFDVTPVGQLVARTVPFLPEKFFVPALGAFEVVLGLALIVGRYLGIVALLMCAHLAGTFLVLVTQPQEAFEHGNPLMLSMTGEFVMKNVVLITAGLLLATRPREREPRHARRRADEAANVVDVVDVVDAVDVAPAVEAA